MSGQSPEELQEHVEQQREQLAGTIDALTAKLDVKSQAQAKVAGFKDIAVNRTTTPEGKPRPEVLAAGAALVAAIVTIVWWRKR